MSSQPAQKQERWINDLSGRRLWLILPFKVVLITAAFAGAFFIRFDLTIPAQFRPLFFELLPVVIIIKMMIFWKMELNQGWWRYVSIPDVIQIVKANVVSSIVFLLYLVFWHGLLGVPRSIILLDLVLCTLGIFAVRFVTRAVRENYLGNFAVPKDATRVLIVGAGNAGQSIAREIQQNVSLKMVAAGFVDDNPAKTGNRIFGIQIFGTRNDLPHICQEERIDEVIIAIPSASGKEIKAIVELCRQANVSCKTLPGIGELIDGSVSVQQIRNVDLEDLLGRNPIRLNEDHIRLYLRGQKVLITGAGGSIGSEICRQVARFEPEEMILVDHAETPLFHIYHELRGGFPTIPLTAAIGDIRDRNRVAGIFKDYRPHVVFHAAAYKHVPMMEENISEAVNNNIRGTRVLADAADNYGCDRFVMISTDKAVNPTNIMGTTKRVAELYVQALSERSKTHFITVRFGNVLGSAGSVVPIFREQILKGGPITVTHPEVTRFFMTIPEASQLVLQAGSMGQGGEIFLLDMGEPVKILRLAEEMIRLSGLRIGEDIDIVFTGLRPGEKLYEELLLNGEGIKPTSHEKIMVADATRNDWPLLIERVERLYAAQRDLDTDRILSLLKELVPEFRPDLAGG